MPKKDDPFGTKGSNKANVNIDTGKTDIILTEEEFRRMQAESPGSFPSTRTVRKKDEKTGAMKKEVQELFRIDAVGRKVRNDDVAAISWTEQPIPQDRYGICVNAYGDHTERPVFIGYDGVVTEKGNVLCNECLEYQDRRLNLAKWIGLGGLLWKPEEF
ncbi:hypothetical protein HQ545_05870 [Candidatus Woesearchaeota archaeon]|nr:hypothetical protein [Candidatus Woesearchaeota archaeon]